MRLCSALLISLHLNVIIVKILGASLPGRCKSKKVLVALVSGSSGPSLECSSTCLPNATARMLSVMKTPKWLQKIL